LTICIDELFDDVIFDETRLKHYFKMFN